MIRWDACRQEFEPDGALRDIYVHGTTIEHWRKLFDALRANYDLEYSADGAARPLPAAVDEAFTTRGTACPELHFRLGVIVVVCHFFTTDEIEFDISPCEVTSQAVLDELLGFLRLVGDTLGKAVIISYENDAQHPFITYESSRREFQYHKFAA
jgi:hypothetical protein